MDLRNQTLYRQAFVTLDANIQKEEWRKGLHGNKSAAQSIKPFLQIFASVLACSYLKVASKAKLKTLFNSLLYSKSRDLSIYCCSAGRDHLLCCCWSVVMASWLSLCCLFFISRLCFCPCWSVNKRVDTGQYS